MPDATNLLLTRRSVPPVALQEPGPTRAQIDSLLTAASRVPDHGKLAPWRFIVVEGANRTLLAEQLAQAALSEPNPDPLRIAQDTKRSAAPLLIVVISRAAPHVKIPEWEQVLSTGAVCMNLLLAAHAMGFAGAWITGRAAYDQSAGRVLGLLPGEKVAGFIYLGTPAAVPADRERPVLTDIVTYWTAT